MDGLEPELAAKLPTLLRIRNALYSQDFRTFMERVRPFALRNSARLLSRCSQKLSAFLWGGCLDLRWRCANHFFRCPLPFQRPTVSWACCWHNADAPKTAQFAWSGLPAAPLISGHVSRSGAGSVLQWSRFCLALDKTARQDF